MPSDINPIHARVLSPTFSPVARCLALFHSTAKRAQITANKKASSGVVVAPWDDQGWSTYHWGHLVYRAGLQSICLLLMHSLAWKIKQKIITKIRGKKNVCLARDCSDSSNAVLRLPVLALSLLLAHVGLHQGAWKMRVFWCWREKTSKTQRAPRWTRLI